MCAPTAAFESAVRFFRELIGHPVRVVQQQKSLVLHGAATVWNNENRAGSSPEPCGTPHLIWKDSFEGVRTGIYWIIKS